jgi:polysaccharide biosynthesis/export protein
VSTILFSRRSWCLLLAAGLLAGSPSARAQTATAPPSPQSSQDSTISTQEFNRRLEQLRRTAESQASQGVSAEYRIGSQDLLEINVFDAPELNRSLRVSANGEISMPLIGAIQVSGSTARQVEKSLEERLRVYMNDPHVGVLVSGVESHPISVLGAVTQPGVFQVRGPKTLLEMLSLAQGLTDDAGDKVLVMRGAGLENAAADPPGSASNSAPHMNSDINSAGDSAPGMKTASVKDSPSAPASAAGRADTTPDANNPNTIQIDLRRLLDSADPRYNVPVYPGDIVKVPKAGIVYVVGDVHKPGGFTIRTNEPMSVLKAMALAEGLDATAAKSRTRVIRTDPATGERTEIPIDLGKIFDGKAPDLPLRAADIVFVPRSGGKAALYRGSEAAIATASGVIIFHP